MTRTERGVIKPLEVPAWQAVNETQETASSSNELQPSNVKRSSIEDFLGQLARPSAGGPRPETASQAAPALAEADRCPHCGARLSSLDYKFNRCLGCGKPPVLAVGAEGEVRNESWTVRL